MTSTRKYSPKSYICIATRRDGKPCTMLQLPNSKYCGHHDPRLAEQRALSSSIGGKARHNRHLTGAVVPVSFRSMEDAFRQLEKVLGDMWSMERSISRDKAIVNTILVGMKVLEVGGMEDRIKRLEALFGGKSIEKLEASYDVEIIQEGDTDDE